ncbi:MAG TPA: alpha/beta fold hydrolase [Solirubrobacteraceae bacterium]|jgi:pimeloyl-ACP methyl ester carboxylesterase|nr:alpha/beta fold hydrolase [Solirubrobacteraceae bacterium]
MARLVLVHGAFGGAWCWEPVIPGLEQAGHSVDTLDLPGAGDDQTPIAEVTLDAYAHGVCKLLLAGPPAVLVGHSMGGMVVTQAAARLPEQVAALVYVSAFVPADGESLLSLTARPEAADDQIQANIVVSGDPPVAVLSNEAARMAIYGNCTEEEVSWALPRRLPQPVVPFTNPFQPDEAWAEAFAALPRSYITCLRDRSIPPAMQRFMFERAGCDPVIELDTDHAPYLSRAAELVSALDLLARLPR